MSPVITSFGAARKVARQTGPPGQYSVQESFWPFLAARFFLGAFLLVCSVAVIQSAELSIKEIEAARKIYVAKCAKCHKFYNPAKYSDEEWNKWMIKMSRKAKLKPQQQELLSRYIDQNLRSPTRVKKPEN